MEEIVKEIVKGSLEETSEKIVEGTSEKIIKLDFIQNKLVVRSLI